MDAKIRVERAKGVRVFGLAYQQFGPWARSPPKAQQPVLGLESGGQTAILAEGLVNAVADAATGGGHLQWAATGNEVEKATAEAETKNAADVREIRLMLEKHSAFDTIINLFFALTKSIATCASQYPDEVHVVRVCVCVRHADVIAVTATRRRNTCRGSSKR